MLDSLIKVKFCTSAKTDREQEFQPEKVFCYASLSQRSTPCLVLDGSYCHLLRVFMKNLFRLTHLRSFLLVFTLGSLLASNPQLHAAQDISAEAYIIIDHQSGHVLDSFNSDKKLQIASLTKIATATVALDWSSTSKQSLDQMAEIPKSITELGPSQGVGFAPGDRASIRDLLYAALLQSDNAAAQAVAEHIGRALGNPAAKDPEIEFIVQMNALARKLGMTKTRFLNPHGLDSLESKLPYSCAFDVAKLASYSMSNPAFRFIVSQKERVIQIQKANGSNVGYRLKNTNELLGKSDIDGVKTGTTKKAGQCLALSAARSPEVKKDGETFFITPRRLQIVVLGSENRFAEGDTLLKRGWNLFEQWVAEGRPEPSKSTRSSVSSN